MEVSQAAVIVYYWWLNWPPSKKWTGRTNTNSKTKDCYAGQGIWNEVSSSGSVEGFAVLIVLVIGRLGHAGGRGQLCLLIDSLEPVPRSKVRPAR